MKTEILKKYTRGAIIALLGLLIMTGGLINDKPTQQPDAYEALREVSSAPKDDALQGPPGSPGNGADAYRYEESLLRIREDQLGAAARDKPTNQVRPTEYTDNEKEQETHSYSLLLPGGDVRDADRVHDTVINVFDQSGVEFKTTAYTAGYESTGKRPGHPLYGITYSGEEVKENHTVAADTDVLPIGTIIQIEGLPGTYVVEDTGSGVNGEHVDIYMEDLDDAKEYGVQYRRIIIIEEGGNNE